MARVWRLQGSIQDIEISMQDLECSRQVSSSFCYPSSHNHRSKKMGPSNSSYWILEIPTTSSTFSFQPTTLVGKKKQELGGFWDFLEIFHHACLAMLGDLLLIHFHVFISNPKMQGSHKKCPDWTILAQPWWSKTLSESSFSSILPCNWNNGSNVGRR